MTEIPTIEELVSQVDNLKAGAAVIFSALQQVYALHEISEAVAEDETKHEVCGHCSALAEAVVAYPCPTVKILLDDFVVEEVDKEETPAE